VNERDLPDGKTHHHDRVADVQTVRALDVGEKRRLDLEPALALRRVVNVIAEAEQQQRRRQKHKPAHRAFHFVQARA
jgi:hypothetical protein